MRKLGPALFIVLSLALVGCQGQAGLPTPAPPVSPPVPIATATAAPATPASPVTATPVPTPTVQSGVVGPLAAGDGLIEALFAAPNSPIRYALHSRGLARSDDGGQSWLQVSDLALPRLLVSPHDPRTLYAGDMAPCLAGGEDPAFRRSRDGGESWQELPGGTGVRPVAEHPSRAGTLYGASCLGLQLSSDAGETWQRTGPTDGMDITNVLPLAGEPLRLLAVLTSEGGSSRLAWFDEAGQPAVGPALGLSFWGQGALAQAGEALYVATSTGVWRSDDGGGQWRQFTDGLADVVLAVDPAVGGLSEADAQRGFGLYALAADPKRPERLALGSERGIYLSEDRGEHWSLAPAGVLSQFRVTGIVWDPAFPDTLYASVAQGTYAVRLPADW